MSRSNVMGVVVLLSIVFLAGCSGTLPGQDAGAATPDQDTPATPTPGQDAPATPAETPTPTETPTTTPTPTSTATPVPEYLDYELYGDDIARQLNNYRGDERWVDGFGDYERDAVGIAIKKPEGWTVQDAEMEGAREVARMSIVMGRNTVEQAQEDGVFLRPDTFHIIVAGQNKTRLSRVIIDADTAAAYATKETSLEEYATHVAESRKIHENAPSDVTISKRKPKLALRAAEYRPFKEIHVHRIATSSPFGNSDINPEIEKVVSVPEEETVYYEYRPGPDANVVAQESQISRTYLETIKEVRDRLRVNRLPKQMVLHQDWSTYENKNIVTTAKTLWALQYFELSDWTLPQNKTMTEREWDAYNNRVSLGKKYIENEDDYDALNETVRSSD